MARVLRDTAWRSLEHLFQRLPPATVVELRNIPPPPPGATVGIRIEIAGPEQTIETSAPKPKRERKPKAPGPQADKSRRTVTGPASP